MGKKSKSKSKSTPAIETDSSPSSSQLPSTEQSTSPGAPSATTTISDLRKDATLWYKILVLIYDLQNIKTDKNSARRLEQATHERYLGAPWFTAEEAVRVRGALIGDGEGETVDEAIVGKLENFFEKRRASGDARPCGPHDLVPVYAECFGVRKEEIGDEGFVRRVGKFGLTN